MPGLRIAASALALALVLGAATPLAAQSYPTKPVKIFSQAGVGSAPDVMARIMADQLTRIWGQQALILNRPGASGALSAQAAAASEPDGYTLLLANSSSFNIMPITQPKVATDLAREFIPVGFVAEQPMLIAVDANAGINTLQELIDRARQRPGELLYAGNSGGSLPNMTGELFRDRAGIDITFVSYPGAAAGLTDVVAWRVPIIVEGLPALHGAIEGGKLKALAVLSTARLPNLPDVPTAADTLPGFVALGWSALLARVGTPPAIADQISRDLAKALAPADIQDKYAKIGAYVRPMTRPELAAFIEGQQATWHPVVRKVVAARAAASPPAKK